ncbi:MAG: M23 family metallopeptidase [Acidobacteria bacterium]|nr:M23 family metallopeptidase [Acidobacteriota bacterium]
MTPRTQIVVGLTSLALSAGLAIVRDRLPEHTGNVITDAPRRLADVLLPRDSDVISSVVPNGATVAGMLGKHLLPESELSALVQAVSSNFDVRKLRAGNIYKIDRLFDGRIRSFEYEIDPTRALRASRREGDIAFEAEVVELPRTTTQVVVEGRIDRGAPSISESLERAGERLDLALAMADIFSGEVDFNSGLQPGDSYRLVVEKSVRDDGLFVGYGPVRAAEFVNDGRMLAAMRFTFPDGKSGYFDTEGRSLKRFFLKTPLKFEPRITSRFSRSRMHPVLKYARAHNGVDYGAPTGAPVVSVSNGTVSFAGWTNGGGRTVRVRHTSGYESEYMHLSAIAPGISPGARVGQGELLGSVGQTGLASGPHLHYGLRRNGQYVNPITEHQNLPPGEPVPAVLKAAFEAERDTLFSAMRQPARVLHTNEN